VHAAAQLDDQTRAFVAEIEAAGAPPIATMSPSDARALQRTFVPQLAGALEAVAQLSDRDIPGPAGPIPIRVYTPDARPLGVLVFLHGGGWTIGSIDTADAACRALSRRTPCTVVSVGYRLAPEHRFPAAFEDAAAAARWAVANADALGRDATRVAIGGDSAGGTLTAAVTLDARDRGGPSLCFQLLVYPVTDCDFNRPTYHEYGKGYLLSVDEMRWYWQNYLRSPQDEANPSACPLRAVSLRGLPPALVLLAECDPIRGEAEAYAARLRVDAVPVSVIRYPGTIHGFFTMPGVMDRAKVAYDDAACALRDAFA